MRFGLCRVLIFLLLAPCVLAPPSRVSASPQRVAVKPQILKYRAKSGEARSGTTRLDYGSWAEEYHETARAIRVTPKGVTWEITLTESGRPADSSTSGKHVQLVTIDPRGNSTARNAPQFLFTNLNYPRTPVAVGSTWSGTFCVQNHCAPLSVRYIRNETLASIPCAVLALRWDLSYKAARGVRRIRSQPAGAPGDSPGPREGYLNWVSLQDGHVLREDGYVEDSGGGYTSRYRVQFEQTPASAGKNYMRLSQVALAALGVLLALFLLFGLRARPQPHTPQ